MGKAPLGLFEIKFGKGHKMSSSTKPANWQAYLAVSLLVLVAVTIAAAVTGLWVLTAIPIGFLFGFFLQKGDLCGASACSEVILMKDARKLWGVWVCIATGMVVFAILDLLGWVQLNPKPFLWLSWIVGGVIFGVGTVLAGGCVSGSLFKAGMGHLTSIMALLGIAIGIAVVEHGPLHPFHIAMKTHVIKAADGGPVTLSSLTGLPFWGLATIFAAATLIVGLVFALRKNRSQQTQKSFSEMFTRPWKPWQAGIAIGILGGLGYLSSAACGRNYPLGVTHGVLHAQLLLTDSNLQHVWKKPLADPSEAPKAPATTPADLVPRKKVSWWLIAEVVSLFLGALVAAKMTGVARLYPKPPEQIVFALLGGLLVGIGAAFATGCVIGNITSGWALMSLTRKMNCPSSRSGK